MSPKSHQNDGFQVEFLKFFRKPQGGLYGCFIMYFDVLELWEAALNDPGMILNEFWKLQKIMIFLKFFRQNDDLCPSFSICLLHRFEVCDVESPSKSCFLNGKKYLSPNDRRDFQESMFSNPKLFKMSQFFLVLTSSSLTPYYS